MIVLTNFQTAVICVTIIIYLALKHGHKIIKVLKKKEL